jgi:hypothetical protein
MRVKFTPTPVAPGDRYGHLVIEREVASGPYGHEVRRMVLVRCDCGDRVVKVLKDLRAGVRSCSPACPQRYVPVASMGS